MARVIREMIIHRSFLLRVALRTPAGRHRLQRGLSIDERNAKRPEGACDRANCTCDPSGPIALCPRCGPSLGGNAGATSRAEYLQLAANMRGHASM
ncbi:MAG: hypothetical protein JWL62_3801 [Hyphomicrobiales bacterium]|nr:hypothetical protein [Hyphomicrobiales bacterium]